MSYRVIFKNASVNVLRIVVSALVALLLPPFLVRILTPDIYGAWSLILQLSMYISFLDFGVQTAVSRFVARAHDRGDAAQMNQVVSTALAILLSAAAVGLVAVIIAAWQIPQIFPEMPVELHAEVRETFLIVGLSLAVGLPFSVFNSIFIGLQRSEIPVAILAGAKLLSSLLIGLAVFSGGGLQLMGLAFAAINLLSYVMQYLAVRRIGPPVELRLAHISRKSVHEIASYCYALSIWSFGMLLVSGLDTVVVGIVDYQAVAYYAIAVTLTNFVIQLQSAVGNALIPAAAMLEARGDVERLGDLLVSSTRYGMFTLLACSLPLIVGAKLILTLWVGPEYAAHTAALLQVLVIANAVRLVAVPYANLLVGTGQQGLVVLSPLAEGIVNLTVSIFLGWRLGAIGVAFGTFAGALVSLGMHLLYNMPRTKGMRINRRRFLLEGVARPLICTLPFMLVLPVSSLQPQPSLLLLGLAVALSAAITLVLFWYFGLFSAERQHMRALLKLR